MTPQLPADVHRAWTADLSAAQLYRILQLRVDVFVVEQRCPYPELDGRDMEETTRHFWIEEPDGRVVSCLRLLEDGDVFRIGRVCTAADA
ncbi:MAG: GNAT family N-acetyltransferase, partial [Saccharopolyspora rectivirgula]